MDFRYTLVHRAKREQEVDWIVTYYGLHRGYYIARRARGSDGRQGPITTYTAPVNSRKARWETGDGQGLDNTIPL